MKKWLDTNWYTVATVAGISNGNSSGIGTAGIHYNITAITQGTDRINRVGREIEILALEIRALIEAGQQTLLLNGDNNNVVRIMLWRPRSVESLTSASALTTILFPVGDAITAIPDYDDVAEIYFDKTYATRTTFGPNSTGSGAATQTNWQAMMHETVSINCPVTYDNTGAANVAGNQILLSAWSDSAFAPSPTASASFRVFFRDL